MGLPSLQGAAPSPNPTSSEDGLRSNRDYRFCVGIICTMIAVALDYRFAPAWYSSSTLLALVGLLLLAYRESRRVTAPTKGVPFPSWPRLLMFGALHAALILAGRFSAASLQSAALHYSTLSSAIVSAKLMVFFPSLALFSRREWMELGRRFGSEMIASAIVLFTFFPYRLFQLFYWPYSSLLGRTVYHISHFFVPYIAYAPGFEPVILGHFLNVRIIFGCLGADGVTLFDWLFGLVVFLEWQRFNKRRALLCYFAGIATFLSTNVTRIVLMVLVGNLVSPDVVERTHLQAGWIFFSCVFVGFLFFAYPYMLDKPQTRTAGNLRLAQPA